MSVVRGVTSEMFYNTENSLVGYVDDSTLIADISRPAARPDVEACLLIDLHAMQRWCSIWGMLSNHKKTKSSIIIRSRTIVSPHASVSFDGVTIEDRSVLKILGVKFDTLLLRNIFDTWLL